MLAYFAGPSPSGEESHRDQHVKKIGMPREWSSSSAASCEPVMRRWPSFVNSAKLDGGEQNLGGPERKGGMQNGTWIQLRIVVQHGLDKLLRVVLFVSK